MSQGTPNVTQPSCQHFNGVIRANSVPYPLMKELITGQRTFLLGKLLVKKSPGETFKPGEEAPGSRGSAGRTRMFRTASLQDE
jgi:hypothetical protein